MSQIISFLLSNGDKKSLKFEGTICKVKYLKFKNSVGLSQTGGGVTKNILSHRHTWGISKNVSK